MSHVAGTSHPQKSPSDRLPVRYLINSRRTRLSRSDGMARSPRRRGHIKPGDIARQRKVARKGVAVTAQELFRIFDQSKILQRVKAGELTERVLRSGPAAPEYGQPPGTESRYVGYIDRAGEKLAEAHYFRCPDGSIGASGRIDPKIVLHQGTLYFVASRDQPGETQAF